MEIIGYGILLAIGFYAAPFVIMAVLGVFVAITAGIASIFGGGK